MIKKDTLRSMIGAQQMKRRWKYVVIEHPTRPLIEVPIIFPDSLGHMEISKLGRAGLAVAAGYCEIDVSKASVKVEGGCPELALAVRREKDPRLLASCYLPAPAAPKPVPEEQPRL